MVQTPIWLTEAEVCSLVTLHDAIAALERVLAMEARGEAANMVKAHLGFGRRDTLHALGAAAPGGGLAATKSWCHTEGGAAPLLILWDASDGSVGAVVEAFALGQMRTGAISGLATRWLAEAGADEMACLGSGEQAATQVAAVHAVRPLRRLRVWSPTKENREGFAQRMSEEFGFEVAVHETVMGCTRDVPIVTCATRARRPFLTAEMLHRGAHVNAVGAIVPDRVEFTQDVFKRCRVVAVDSLEGVRALSQEFCAWYGVGPGSWDQIRPLSSVIAEGMGRPAHADLTLFKAMGMGLSDLALGIEVLARAREKGVGMALPERVRAAPPLRAGEAG